MLSGEYMRIIRILLLAILAGCVNPCNNQIVQEAVSPDGRYAATAFIRDCGATTDFSPQVFLRKTGDRLAELVR